MRWYLFFKDIRCFISDFSCCCDIMPDRSNFREEGFILAHRSMAHHGGRAWQQCKAAAHPIATVRKQRDECWCSAHVSIVTIWDIQSGTPPHVFTRANVKQVDWAWACGLHNWWSPWLALTRSKVWCQVPQKESKQKQEAILFLGSQSHTVEKRWVFAKEYSVSWRGVCAAIIMEEPIFIFLRRGLILRISLYKMAPRSN